MSTFRELTEFRVSFDGNKATNNLIYWETKKTRDRGDREERQERNRGDQNMWLNHQRRSRLFGGNEATDTLIYGQKKKTRDRGDSEERQERNRGDQNMWLNQTSRPSASRKCVSTKLWSSPQTLNRNTPNYLPLQHEI